MAFHYVFSLISILFLNSFMSTLSTDGGFSVDLIHRDSPQSPFYNSQETPSQRLKNAFRRSMNRVNRFSPSKFSTKTAQTEIVNDQGEYLMSFSLGTPAMEIVAIADTGSDLIWTQCFPCKSCYKQIAPMFDPAKSRTYRKISCDADMCESLEGSSCNPVDGSCKYSYSYGDQSYSNGNLAVETFTLGSTSGRNVTLPKTVFGCGHNNGGTFSEKGSGIVGLGGGSISLITQMGNSIGRKFSYCLVPYSSRTGNTSKINFGSRAILSGKGVQTTPLVSKNPDTFYFLTLEAISVGTKRIEFSGSSFGTSSGNIIIDSGTTLTLVPQDFYDELSSAVDEVAGGERVDDPSGLLSLCYNAKSALKLPTLTAHFTGADVELTPLNTFIQISEDVVCFAFNPNDNGAIFGNLSQMNMLVAYDLQAKTVSFKAADCTK